MTDDMKHDIETIRAAFQRMHDFAVNDGPPYMSIPARPTDDADLILSTAIDELAALRESDAALRARVEALQQQFQQSEVDAGEAHAKADAARLREVMAPLPEKIQTLCIEIDTCDSPGPTSTELLRYDVVGSIRDALSATDSAEWLAQHDAEVVEAAESRADALRKRLDNANEYITTQKQQLLAATNDAARAELRAKELAAVLQPIADRLHESHEEIGLVASELCGPMTDALAAAPDSDARLREVMEKAWEKGRTAGWLEHENEERKKFGDDQRPVQSPKDAIDEVLRGGA